MFLLGSVSQFITKIGIVWLGGGISVKLLTALCLEPSQERN